MTVVSVKMATFLLNSTVTLYPSIFNIITRKQISYSIHFIFYNYQGEGVPASLKIDVSGSVSPPGHKKSPKPPAPGQHHH